MNRRQSLKALSISTIGGGLFVQSCKTDTKEVDHSNIDSAVGLEEFEVERLKKLYAEPAFFDAHEKSTLILLADLIIPKDAISGGLKWLDLHCLNNHGQSFIGCTSAQQLEVLEQIAYVGKTKPELRQGEVFFSRMRDLTATGFYTSAMGIKDIGYLGNVPNIWEGVPKDVLKQYNLSDV